MPAMKPAAHATDLDYDLAMLGDPLTDDALDALSTLIDARDAATELLAHLAQMQTALESGAPAYQTREQYAVDLEQLADTIHINVSGLLG